MALFLGGNIRLIILGPSNSFYLVFNSTQFNNIFFLQFIINPLSAFGVFERASDHVNPLLIFVWIWLHVESAVNISNFTQELQILIVGRCIISDRLYVFVPSNQIDWLSYRLVDFRQTVVFCFSVEKIVLFSVPGKAAHIDHMSIKVAYCFGILLLVSRFESRGCFIHSHVQKDVEVIIGHELRHRLDH